MKLKDTALQSNHDRVRSVVRVQFGEYVTHVALHGRFADGELVADEFV
jgi:hypothetical protein